MQLTNTKEYMTRYDYVEKEIHRGIKIWPNYQIVYAQTRIGTRKDA